MIKRFWLFFSCLLATTVHAWAQSSWPKEIDASNGGVITMYQPQPESFSGNKLSGRAALSYKKSKDAEPVFGVAWFDATLETNKDNRTAVLESMKITKSKFAEQAKDGNIENVAQLIEAEAPKWELEVSLDDIAATVKQEQRLNSTNLKNDPPKIIYRNKPTTLVTIDGTPNIKKDDQLKMDRVINTPFLIFKYPEDQKFYLYAGSFWYRSSIATGGYTHVASLPSKLKDLDKQIKEAEAKDENLSDQDRPMKPTDIVVSTEPAELIQTEGAPSYKTVSGTTLLYADNTLDEIFKDVNTNKTYTLISGRWYSANNLTGPWNYTASDNLPADFSKIPQGSEKDGVLANVAGTEAAEEAVMDAQIPQTVKVDRKTAKCEVQYDGSPKFSNIENTSLQVAENSSVTVIKAANGKYYAVDNGIWFISNNATGPWEVANERPQDVENIPPSNQAYNTKYVYVYDQTPDYVYQGYTPGYTGNYVSGPTVVYGTGYYYRPWYGSYYYPRPWSFGFGFSYNPWSGWNMGWNMSFNFGWFHLGFGGGWGRPGWGGGWWGPPMFRPPLRPWGWNGGYYGGGGWGGRPGGWGGRPGGWGGGNNININKPNININRPININIDNSHNNVNIGNNNNNIYKKRPGTQTRDIARNPDNKGYDAKRPAGGNNRLPGNNNVSNQRPTTKPEGGKPATRPGVEAKPGVDAKPGVAAKPGVTTKPGGVETKPGVTTRPSVEPNTGASKLPNDFQTKPGETGVGNTGGARPTTGRPAVNEKNNVVADKSGNVYQRDDKGNWNTRDQNQWKPATQPATNEVTREQHNRDRSDMRNRNYQQAQQKRPTTPSYNRPTTPSYNRPQSRPTTPSYNRPSTRPSTPSSRPSSRPATRPTTRGRM